MGLNGLTFKDTKEQIIISLNDKMERLILVVAFLVHGFNLYSQDWLPVGSGTNNGYNGGITLKTFNGKLFAGGAFDQAGTAKAKGIAMWDGIEWSIVDTTMNNFFAVRPLIIFRGELYGFVGGDYNKPCHMMRLDSKFKWHVVPGSDFYHDVGDGNIYTAAVFKNELYVGGWFDSVGNVSANHVAKWDGKNWMPVGTGTDRPEIWAMEVYNNELYIGGGFKMAGGNAVNNLAKWDGKVWSDVGGGIEQMYASVRVMEVYKNELYIGGKFEYAGGKPMDYITKWNGTSFSDVGGGLRFAGFPSSFKVYGDRLIIGGYFNDGLFQNQVGTWDGVRYDSLGIGLNAGPTDFEIYNNQLYAGGRFNEFGYPSFKANGVAVLDTSVLQFEVRPLTISIYPNPFSDQTKISFSESQKNVTIKLIDVQGKIIRKIKFNGISLTLNKEDLPSGEYFVQVVESEGKIITEKVVAY